MEGPGHGLGNLTLNGLSLLVEVGVWLLTVDDLVAVEGALFSVKVPHLETKEILFGDHGRDFVAAEVVQSERFDVAGRVSCSIDHYEAADGQVINLSD